MPFDIGPSMQASYDTGVAGLAWSVRRRNRGHETLTQFALSTRLIVAKALRRLRRLDEAEYAFKVLAGALREHVFTCVGLSFC